MKTHQRGGWIPRSLKWVGLSTLIFIVPGGLILWGAQEIIRWKRNRARSTEVAQLASDPSSIRV